jgi:hypothetical protein
MPPFAVALVLSALVIGGGAAWIALRLIERVGAKEGNGRVAGIVIYVLSVIVAGFLAGALVVTALAAVFLNALQPMTLEAEAFRAMPGKLAFPTFLWSGYAAAVGAYPRPNLDRRSRSPIAVAVAVLLIFIQLALLIGYAVQH